MSKLQLVLTVVLTALLSPLTASAAVPTEVTDLITTLITDIGTLFTAAVAIWVAVKGFIMIIRLGNRFINSMSKG